MSLFAFTIDHENQGLAAVEQATKVCHGLTDQIFALEKIAGVVLLTTCNRVEVFVDATGSEPQLKLQKIFERNFGELAQIGKVLTGKNVIKHLFRLACGLESQVVGEREIAGQLRRALSRAKAAKTTSFLLTQTIEASIKTSKRVAKETGIAARGRSIVAIGLDLVAKNVPLTGKQAMIVGTGNYAGAVSAALHERNLSAIYVHSLSGRATQFATRHKLTPVAENELVTRLSETDLVVTCRGFASPAIPYDLVKYALALRPTTTPMVLLDLALTHDVDPKVNELANVTVINLEDIKNAVPEADQVSLAASEKIIAEELANFDQQLAVREIAPELANVQQWADRLVQNELAKLPEELDYAAVKARLTHLAGVMAHIPTSLLRTAATTDWIAPLVDQIRQLLKDPK